VRVQPFERAHLPQLLELVNLHLAAVVPGWAITEEFLAEMLERNCTEYITDPWVEERATLCAVEGHRVLAAAHLLRYATGPEVNDSSKGTGEVDWFLSPPGRSDAASAVLSSARDHLASWEVSQEYGWGGGIPAGPPLWGVPDAWPHVAAALDAAGYESPPRRHREAIYGGTLGGVPEPEEPPITGRALRRTVGPDGTRFAAILDGQESWVTARLMRTSPTEEPCQHCAAGLTSGRYGCERAGATGVSAAGSCGMPSPGSGSRDVTGSPSASSKATKQRAQAASTDASAGRSSPGRFNRGSRKDPQTRPGEQADNRLRFCPRPIVHPTRRIPLDIGSKKVYSRTRLNEFD
jgi:hypothetical protein